MYTCSLRIHVSRFLHEPAILFCFFTSIRPPFSPSLSLSILTSPSFYLLSFPPLSPSRSSLLSLPLVPPSCSFLPSFSSLSSFPLIALLFFSLPLYLFSLHSSPPLLPPSPSLPFPLQKEDLPPDCLSMLLQVSEKVNLVSTIKEAVKAARKREWFMVM